MTWRLCVVLVLLASASGDAQIRIRGVAAVAGDCDEGTVPATHPHSFLNDCFIGEYDTMVSAGGWEATRWQNMLDAYDGRWADLGSTCSMSTFASDPCRNWLLSLGLACQLLDEAPQNGTPAHTQQDFCDKGVDQWNWVVANIDPVPLDNWHDTLFMALAYDFLFDHMTQAEARAAIQWFKDSANTTGACAYPWGNIIDSQAAMCATFRVGVGLAAKGDNLGDATLETWVADQYAKYNTEFRASTGLVYYENFTRGTTGGDASEGFSYQVSYTDRYTTLMEEMFRTALGRTTATHYAGVEGWACSYPRVVFNHLFAWKESGGNVNVQWAPYRQNIRWLPTETLQKPHGRWFQRICPDADLAGLARHVEEDISGVLASDASTFSVLYDAIMILMSPAVQPTKKTPSDISLPLFEYASDQRVRARGSWTDANTWQVWMEADRWGNGRYIGSQAPGSVTYARKGTVSGLMGTDGNGSNPGQGTGGGHNGMCFPDRSVTDIADENSQGCNRKNPGNLADTASLTTDSVWDYISERRVRVGASKTYVGVDLTRSFDTSLTTESPDNLSRISSYRRQVAWLGDANGIRIIEFDDADSTDTKYEHTWIHHFANDPTIVGGDGGTANTPVRNPATCETGKQCDGTGLGHWLHTGAITGASMTMTDDSASGLVTWTKLLPATIELVKVGGPDDATNRFNNSGTYSAEITDLYGQRTAPSISTGTLQYKYTSSYHIEVTEATPTTTPLFLNCIQLQDSGATPTTCEVYPNGADDNDFLAVEFGTDFVFVVGEDGWSKTSGDAIFKDAGTYTVTWCSLNPSVSRTFTFGTNITSIDGDSDGAYSEAADVYGCVDLTIIVGMSGSTAPDNLVAVS